jgi:hypothetical protein
MKRTLFIGILAVMVLSACGGDVDLAADGTGRDVVIQVFKPPN